MLDKYCAIVKYYQQYQTEVSSITVKSVNLGTFDENNFIKMAYNSKPPPRESNQMVFGIRAVIEAILAGKEIEALYIQRGLGGGLLTELRDVTNEYGITPQQVPVEKLNRITMKNHQGAIAFISPIIYQKIENIIPDVFERGEVPLVLVLDSITDVRNMGAIARTAECAGVHAIVIPAKGSAQINPDAIKTSAGALYKIPVCRHDNFMQTVKFFRNRACNWFAVPKKQTTISTRPIIPHQRPSSWARKKTASATRSSAYPITWPRSPCLAR
jgi:23S rRNA (guanosine2251-2'-O)-methyltransferase